MAEVVIDCCTLIDLCASGHLEAILAASGYRWHIPSAVLAEGGCTYRPSEDDPQVLIPIRIDTATLISRGVLALCDPAPGPELNDFVGFAAQFRADGEAACLAIAKSRNWTVATDDRKAWRVATSNAIAVVTAPELIKSWADKTSLSMDELGAILREIQTGARYVPNKNMPLHQWWVNAARIGC
jgi:hypothetical protein